MKRKKLLKKLAEFFDMKERKQRKHYDDLEVLLIRLEKKKTELERERQREKNEHKQKRLGKELDIVNAQHAKGLRALQELKAP